MYSIVFVACSIFLLSDAQDKFSCSGRKSGNYARGCDSVFFSCTKAGDAIPRECPPTTYYDEEPDVCELRRNVPACTGKPRPTKKPTTDRPPSDTPVGFNCQDIDDGNYQPGKCKDHFFQCSGFRAFRVMCPGDLRYSFRDDACLRPINVPGCPEFDGSSPCGGRPNGFYRDANDCNKFLFCVDQFFFSLNCPEGLVYSDETKRCMTRAETLPPCGFAEPPEPFECKENGLFPSKICDMYYRCKDGETELLGCEAGYAFSSVTRSCQMAVLVPGCTPSMDRDLVRFCVNRGKDGIYSFPGNCHRSVVCIENVPFAFFCSQKHRPDFDPDLLSCVPNVNGCDDEVDDQEQITQSPSVEFDCDGLKDGNYPAGECEDHFYQCSNFDATRVTCPNTNLRYSFRDNACREPIDTPGCPEFSSPCTGRPNGFYQDPSDCTKFLFCVDKFHFSLNCPEGLVYSDERKRCTTPEQTVPPCGTAEPPPPFECVENGLFPSKSCATYYECTDGEKEEKRCIDGYAFNLHSNKCETAVLVPGCMPTMDQDLIRFCVSKKKDGIFPFPGNCHRSVVCIQNIPFVFFCSLKNRPDFDPDLLSCVPFVKGCEN